MKVSCRVQFISLIRAIDRFPAQGKTNLVTANKNKEAVKRGFNQLPLRPLEPIEESAL